MRYVCVYCGEEVESKYPPRYCPSCRVGDYPFEEDVEDEENDKEL